MKAKYIYLTIAFSALSISTYNLYGQTGSQENKDTALIITKEEYLKEKAENKERIAESRDAKKQTRSRDKISKQVQGDVSDESKKANIEEKKTQNARKDASEPAQKDFDARDKREK